MATFKVGDLVLRDFCGGTAMLRVVAINEKSYMVSHLAPDFAGARYSLPKDGVRPVFAVGEYTQWKDDAGRAHHGEVVKIVGNVAVVKTAGGRKCDVTSGMVRLAL